MKTSYVIIKYTYIGQTTYVGIFGKNEFSVYVQWTFK